MKTHKIDNLEGLEIVQKIVAVRDEFMRVSTAKVKAFEEDMEASELAVKQVTKDLLNKLLVALALPPETKGAIDTQYLEHNLAFLVEQDGDCGCGLGHGGLQDLLAAIAGKTPKPQVH